MSDSAGHDDPADHEGGGTTFGDRLWCALGMDGTHPTVPARGLPMPQPWMPSVRPSAYYAVTAMDRWGRLADRSPLSILSWPAGMRLALMVTRGAVVARPDHEGRDAVTRQGHLRLPARLRHRFRLTAGDRLLLTACPDRGFLIIHPVAVLDALVLIYHSGTHGETAGGGGTP